MKVPQVIEIQYVENGAEYFNCLKNQHAPVWLDSCHPYSEQGRYDILSANPHVTIDTVGDTSEISQHLANNIVSKENPFDLLQRYLPPKHSPATFKGEDLPFCGGALGFLGYDLGRTLELLPKVACNDNGLADCSVGIYSWGIVVDHGLKRAFISALEGTNLVPATALLSNVLLPIKKLKSLPEKENKIFKIKSFKNEVNAKKYANSINIIHQYIQSGDCYQVNYAQRFSTNYEGELLSPYLRLREALPSPFSAYIPLKQGALLCLSPERFIGQAQGVATTSPIKGTISRGETPAEDNENQRVLSESAKDRAENLMIVDLLRNDLSKTCTEVKAPKLFELQSFANVHHLVSTITGKLRDTETPVSLLKAAFPGGSITGAPKIRAMQIIEQIESHRRGPYCGSVIYISACGRMDSNIIIRTVIADNGKLHVWGGGGIVADSVAAAEYQESLTKVQLLMDTLENEFLENSCKGAKN